MVQIPFGSPEKDRFRSVSYTHLDVYKRQVIEGAPQAAPEIYTVESAVAKAREFTDGGM